MNRLLKFGLLASAGLLLAGTQARAAGYVSLTQADGVTPVSPASPLPVTGTFAATITPTAPYVLTSTGFQMVASFTTSTGFTPPATSTVCFIQAEGNPVRFRTDGTAPTATVGQLLAVGALLQETANLAGIRFIPTTGAATLDVDCYR